MYPGTTYDVWVIVMFCVWLFTIVLMIGGWITVVIALWRSMKAQESLAESVERINESLMR